MTRTIRSLYFSGSLCASSNVSVDVTAHTLSGFYDTPHGIANAIMLPWVMEYNATACPERFAHIAAAMGKPVSGLSVTDTADKAIAAVKQ